MIVYHGDNIVYDLYPPDDPRDGARMLVAANTGHLGPTVMRSDDRGATWTEASKPPAFHPGERLGRSVDKVFWLTAGHATEPGSWYAGGVPQGLFRSDDGGDTWEPVDGWNDHPDWEKWAEYPYQGTPDGAMLHSVNIDPRDPAQADHLARFGSHCLAGSDGAAFAWGAIDGADKDVAVVDSRHLNDFVDTDLATVHTPAITALRWSLEDVGRAAAELLLQRLRGDFGGGQSRALLEVDLVLRESCAPPLLRSSRP